MPKYWNRIDDLSRQALSISVEEFRVLHPSPVLVARQIRGGKLREKTVADINLRDTGPIAHHHKKPDQQLFGSTLVHIKPEDVVGRVTQPHMLVDRPMTQEIFTLVRKSERTPRDRKITVGRTDSSDVVVNDYSVSKKHAYFTIDPHLRAILLYDSGSTNGTFVGGKRLESKGHKVVQSGQNVGFGRYTFLFLTATEFYRYLTHGMGAGGLTI
jgi:hypothetical protein